MGKKKRARSAAKSDGRAIEAEETSACNPRGAVDAFVVQESEGHRVYTLEGSDLPYSALVERMQQGAAMLDAEGSSFTALPAWLNSWECRENR